MCFIHYRIDVVAYPFNNKMAKKVIRAAIKKFDFVDAKYYFASNLFELWNSIQGYDLITLIIGDVA